MPPTSISVSPNDNIIAPGTPVAVTINHPYDDFPSDGEVHLTTDLNISGVDIYHYSKWR